LASYFPLQWCLNFDKEEFRKYRVENENGSDSEEINTNDETPFATVEACQGPVKYMVCLQSA